MNQRDVVVIGASAGGLEAISQILGALPEDLDAAVLIVLHTAARPESLLPRILERIGKLPVCHPEDGDILQRGRVYVAPPGFHMMVEQGYLREGREKIFIGQPSIRSFALRPPRMVRASSE